MRIADVRAFPTSFPVPPEASVTLGIGRAVKRDSVVVKVTTDDGVIGGGESHHGRSPGAVAHHANTTLRQLIVGMAATDVVAIRNRRPSSRRRGMPGLERPGLGLDVDEEFGPRIHLADASRSPF
jgi:L-alanine-DL-glutamate epimerase-like enolase superfamily enzyme